MTRIGLAQLRYGDAELADREQRAAMTVAAVERLSAAGAEVIVLPELAACGYVLDPDHLSANAEPSEPSGPVVGAWAAAAARLGVFIVGGYAEAVDGRLYNAAIALGPDGAVIGRYRKLHLFGAEHELFAPGDLGLPVFEIAGLRAGLLICYDMRFPETVRILALGGAEAVLVPTAWVGGFDTSDARDGRFIGQIEAVLVHANLNQTYVLCADFAGSQRDLLLFGQSLGVDPYGSIVAGPAPRDHAADVLVEVDPAVVAVALDRGVGISPRTNRRSDVYGPRLGYVDPEPVSHSPRGADG